MLSLRTSATSIIKRAALARTFATTARVQSGSSVHSNDPEIIQKEKDRNLSGKQHETSAPHKKHAPGWNEHLASDSEANVKADQAPPGTADELTKETIDYIKKRHADDPTPSTSGQPTDDPHQYAQYSKEEVQGPLAGKGSDHGKKVDRDNKQS